MPKGYWIARLDVTDAETYKNYVQANAEAFAKYGAKFLARGGPFTALEGQNRSRNVILEFESVDIALACYNSPEYQRAFDIRRNAAVADIVIMAGYDGPQPPEQPGEQANVDYRGPQKLESYNFGFRDIKDSLPKRADITKIDFDDLMGGALA